MHVCPSWLCSSCAAFMKQLANALLSEKCAGVQPTSTRHAPGGMRKVQSTQNFSTFHSQAGYVPPPSHSSLPGGLDGRRRGGIRPSPSMPTFTAFDQQSQYVRESPDDARDPRLLAQINEEQDDGLRLSEPLQGMFMDEPYVENDDLMSLMKDLQSDPSTAPGLDLDTPLMGQRGQQEPTASGNAAGSGGGGAASGGAGQAHRASSDVMPSFLQLEGGLDAALPPLDEDEFNSVFMDAS
jgi:hypothetical protein